MATDSPKDIVSSSDDESIDEDGSSGRRRRFCIERVPDAPPSVKVSSKRDRSSIDYDGSGYSRNTSKRRMTGAPHMEPRHDHRVPHQIASSHHRHQHERQYQHPHPHQYQSPYPHAHHHHYHPHEQHHQQQQQQQHHHHHQHHHQQPQHQHQQQPQPQPQHQDDQHQQDQQQQQQPSHQQPSYRDAQTGEVRRSEVRPNAPPKHVKNKETTGPTVFLNPKMIKKFIGKSIELASTSSSQSTNASTFQAKGSYHDVRNPPALSTTATTSSAINPTDTIDLKTSSRESLQAASTMAIIRLVTECIKNDSKRDEKLNKVLVARLIDQLTKHERENDDRESPEQEEDDSYKHHHRGPMNYVSSDGRHGGISHHGQYELGAGGQPIPVIGSSFGNRYNSPNSRVGGSKFPPAKQQQRQQGTHYQHRPRHVSSDPRDLRHSESQNNKLRNYSR